MKGEKQGYYYSSRSCRNKYPFVLNGLKAGGHEIWAHPNATKHMVNYLTKNPLVKELSPKSKQMIEQLTSFRTAVEKAIPNLKLGKIL